MALWLTKVLDLLFGRLEDRLMAAVSAGNLARVRRLILAGANPNACIGSSSTPRYSRSSRIGEKYEDERIGDSVLDVAAKKGHLKILKLLIEAGVDPRTGVYGPGPLEYALNFGHAEIVHFLITIGADVNSADTNGTTPLMSAAACGHLAVVELFAK